MADPFESATSLAGRIQRRECSSRELTEMYIDRIERHDGALNAVVVRDFERALVAADAADGKLARGAELGPLHGVPMTVKESYDIEGLPTTWGIPAFKDNLATEDAFSVQRFQEAGAHFIGKTNVPLNLSDFQSFNDIYGTTNNPWNVERGPGGSSGGTAAALAAGLSALDLGSDIGGSIRNPAHFCGVYGHKPSYGICPMKGHALPGAVAEPDIAVCGPLARDAEDLRLAFDTMAGPGPLDAPGWRLELPAPRATSLADLRIAVWPTEGEAPVSTAVADRVQAVADRLARLGATVSDSARPGFELGSMFDTYLYMLNGVTSAGLPQEIFDGMQAQAAELDPHDHSRAAVMLRSNVQTHREWNQRHHFRTAMRWAWRAFFQEWDVLLCPIAQTTAFPHDHRPFGERTLRVDNEDRGYFEGLFWASLAIVGRLPSTVFPTGPAADGLPIGLQVMSAEYHDHTTLEFARLIADELDGFQPPPAFRD